MPLSSQLLTLALLQAAIALSAVPSWVANPNLNAGEVVAVNENNPATFVPAGTTLPRSQNYNFSGFTSVPRVVLSIIGYGQLQPMSFTQQLGFKLTITGINFTSFNYTVTSYDVTTVLLRYNYIAVQLEQNTFYLDRLALFFNASDNVANPTAPQRYMEIDRIYPEGMINSDYLTHQIIALAFPTGFKMQASSGISHFSLNAWALNATHLRLNISTVGNNVLSQLGFSVVCFDRTKITGNYSVYIDLILYRLVGNISTNLGDVVTNQTYVYRNGLSGGVDILFYLNSSQAQPNFFYYNYLSFGNDSIIFRGFNYRLTNCPNNLTYYQPSTVLCFDLCPAYSYANTTSNLCLPCHYSCLHCSSPDTANTCISCNPVDRRSINSNSCPCQSGYFDNGTAVCGPCDSSCLTCANSSQFCVTCNLSLNRAITANNSCECIAGFYQNSTCLSCGSIMHCLTCVYVSSNWTLSCISCDSSLFRTTSTNSSTCLCELGFYEDVGLVCQPCNSGCTDCFFNGSSQECTNCNATLGLSLTAGACDCLNGSVLLNGVCVASTNTSNSSLCGNSIIQIGQECDDGNPSSYDGCSSSCQVEESHTCLVNSSLANYSICYYDGLIAFTTEQIYKQPGQNSVSLRLKISAPNCNRQTLKQYLEKTDYLRLYDRTRLLFSQLDHNKVMRLLVAWVAIPTKYIFFDQNLNLLYITFSYDASIDLSKKYIELGPSSALSNPYLRYFYATPTGTVPLAQPFNNLATTFYSQQQLSVVSTFSLIYLAVIVLHWVVVLVGMIVKQGAVGAECMLVLQLSYLSMIDQETVMQCMAGLQLAGKYTIGLGISVFQKTTVPDLLALGLEVNMVNSFFVVSCLLLASFVGLAVLAVVERKQRKRIAERPAVSEEDNNHSERSKLQGAKILGPQKITITSKALSYCFEVFLTISVVEGAVLALNLTFTTSESMLYNTTIAAIYLVCVSVVWILLSKNNEVWSIRNTSFINILSRANDSPRFLSYYYLGITITAVIAGVVMSLLRNSGVVALALIMVGCIAAMLAVGLCNVYKDRLDKIRAICNCIVTVLLMVVALMGDRLFGSLGLGMAIAVVSVTLLVVVALFNLTIVIVTIHQNNKISDQIKSRQNQEIQMKEMIDELGIANLAFLGQIPYQHQLRDDRARKMTLLGDLRSSLVSEDENPRMYARVEEKINQLRALKQILSPGLTEAKVNELVDICQEEVNWALEAVEQLQPQPSKAKSDNQITNITGEVKQPASKSSQPSKKQSSSGSSYQRKGIQLVSSKSEQLDQASVEEGEASANSSHSSGREQSLPLTFLPNDH